MTAASAALRPTETAGELPLGRAAPTARTLHDRATWWLLAIVLLSLAGFSRTVSTRLGQLDWAHLLHGGASLGWLLLLAAQSELARRGQRQRHRSLAVIGVGCALVMSMSAVPMMQALWAGAVAVSDDFRRSTVLRFLVAMNVGLLVCLLALLAVALSHVRQRAIHSRAMAATALLALPAGLGRWVMRLLGLDPMGGSLVALGVAVLWLALLAISDRRHGVRDWVYPAGAMALTTVTGAAIIVARTWSR